MAKSNLTIYRELEKERHAKTPLGMAEKRIKYFYDLMYKNKFRGTKEQTDYINSIRTDNENRINTYIQDRMKIDKDAINDMLLESMTKEIEFLETLPINQSTTTNE